MKEELEKIKVEGLQALKGVETLDALELLRIEYFGRRGRLTDVMKGMGKLSKEERPEIGKLANEVRTTLTEAFEGVTERLHRQQREQQLQAEAIDITLPGRKPAYGKAHPVMQVLERIEAIFGQMGFEVVTGPDVETEYYNFDALNTPADHPARDLHDTFYLTDGHLLRTHTSPVQIRTMENQKPPVRIIVPGKCYRVDYDISHTPMFHHVEVLLVDRHVTFSELKGILTSFARQMFGDQTQMRFRPHFFPFTEPSAEVDISCTVCQGKGCRSCGNTGWTEILGAGAVDPAVFEAVNYNPDEVTGFAFGIGVERIANLLFRIPDMRTFYENDLRFLRQF
ncbi:phenylalanine--tRNA ligase subunit alpha [Candidatus Poribacteria bacterium]|nr:phenylalanine--tRNA ligase subunit alpha [Candidatus Poribacteria bacterium]MYK16676.1 phenylalanine--tRNA ligase subunit alpha [Candidatus Poribacteria bacterium]